MRLYFAYILVVLFLFSSCEPQKKQAPYVPIEKTMLLDFAYFNNTGGGNYFKFASEKVLAWEELLEDSIVMHKEILKIANASEFSFQKDNIWLTEIYLPTGVFYKTLLFATIDADTIHYETYLNQSEKNDFLILEGSTYNNGKNGSWVYYKEYLEDTITVPKKILLSRWDFSSNNKIYFTNNIEGADSLNVILFMDSVDNDYNKYIEIFNNITKKTSKIQWNSSSKAGRIKDSIKYNNENWHNWNSKLENTN